MSSEQPDYRSYLLRLWRANGEDPDNWRVSLESTRTRQLHVFPSLTALFGFLQRQIAVGRGEDKNECDGSALP